jgi:uncharacterized protein
VKQKVSVRPAKHGLGLFAAKTYWPGDVIIKVTGRIVDAGVLWERRGTFADNCYRFGPETYLDPGDAPGRYVNHSCEPNAGVRKRSNQLFLFAAAQIESGDEIFIDYSTILGDDDVWTMQCSCGRRTCRKTIRRFGALPTALKERYVESGLVPGYIINTLRRRVLVGGTR